MKNMINNIYTLICEILEGDEELTDLMIIGYLLPVFYKIIGIFLPISYDTLMVKLVLFDISWFGLLFGIVVSVCRLGKIIFEDTEILNELEEEES